MKAVAVISLVLMSIFVIISLIGVATSRPHERAESVLSLFIWVIPLATSICFVIAMF